MNNPCASSSTLEQQPSRLERERARKCAKRARESLVETNNRKRAIKKEILCIGYLNQRLSVCSILLLVSSMRQIVGHLNQRPSIYSILLLLSSERLTVELLSQRLS